MDGLPLKDFFELTTYGGMFDNIPLINHPNILAWFQAHPSCNGEFHLDGTDLWTQEGWIREAIRRKEIDEILNPKPPTNPFA